MNIQIHELSCMSKRLFVDLETLWCVGSQEDCFYFTDLQYLLNGTLRILLPSDYEALKL